jgi:prepilin-type N-terminal cleavage/methylation domain-containing protein
MKKRKRALTLLEIMIVIALITLISGVISYNMRGTLDKGRAFRTEHAKEQLHDMLLLCLTDGTKAEQLLTSKTVTINHLKSLGLAKDAKNLLVDGWGNDFEITPIDNGNDFEIKSKKYDEHKKK